MVCFRVPGEYRPSSEHEDMLVALKEGRAGCLQGRYRTQGLGASPLTVHNKMN